MDSRKISQLNAARYKDAASASGKAAATGAWRQRRCSGMCYCTHSATWEHLSKVKIPGCDFDFTQLHPATQTH